MTQDTRDTSLNLKITNDMARPIKNDIEYFSFDVSFFDDPKLLFVSSKFDEHGELIAVKLLCWIYRNDGYYTEWNDEISMLFTKRSFTNIKITMVNDVVAELIKRGFFNEGLFKRFGVLTSNGIQRRWREATKRRKVVIEDKYNLIDKCIQGDTETTANDTLTQIDDTVTQVKDELTSAKDTVSTQSKGKEITLKEITLKDTRSKELQIVDIRSKYDLSLNFAGLTWEWIEYRKEIKDAYKTDRGVTAFVNKLKTLSRGDFAKAKELVDHAMNNEWKSIYEINKNDNGETKNNSKQNGVSDDYKRSILADMLS